MKEISQIKKSLFASKNRMPEARKAEVASKMIEMCILALSLIQFILGML